MTTTNDCGTVSAMPDEALTAILIRLIPKPGEPRLVAFQDGQLDLYMTPESASVWMEMLERLDALAAEHGPDRMMEIYDASTVLAHTHWGAAQ